MFSSHLANYVTQARLSLEVNHVVLASFHNHPFFTPSHIAIGLSSHDWGALCAELLGNKHVTLQRTSDGKRPTIWVHIHDRKDIDPYSHLQFSFPERETKFQYRGPHVFVQSLKPGISINGADLPYSRSLGTQARVSVRLQHRNAFFISGQRR